MKYDRVTLKKKKNRISAKKSGIDSSKVSYVAGATAATVAIGGIAAATFPLAFPTIVGAVISSTIMSASKKEKKAISSKNTSKRASEQICYTRWMSEAFEAVEENEVITE